MNDKSDKAETNKPAATKDPQPIRVALIEFAPAMLNIPGKGITARVSAKDDRYVLEYLPWMQHHRITWSQPGDKPPIVKMVHVSHVGTWEPMTP